MLSKILIRTVQICTLKRPQICATHFAWAALRLAVVLIVGTIPLLSREVSGQGLPLPEELAQQQRQQVELVSKIVLPTVCVHMPDGNGGGSGVLISPEGFALTNYHVVEPCGSYMQCTLSDGRLYDAVIVGIDPTGDVALIQLLGRLDFPVAELGDSDSAKVGETCFAVGNPFLLATNRQPTVSKGIISGTHRYQEPAGSLLEYTDCLQIDAAVNPGNSGGPLFNSQGQLIGINGRCSFEKRGRINVGVAYAISIKQIQLFLGALRSGRVVDHATLAATFASEKNESGGQRVILDGLLENSDAAEVGLEYGDQLLQFGGAKINTVNQFKNRLGIFPDRWYVPIRVLRDDSEIELRVRLTSLHTTEELQETALPFQPRPNHPKLSLPDGQQPVASKIPELAAQRIEHRVGFVNFYFNRLQMERIQSLLDSSSNTKENSKIVWSGDDRDRGDLKLALAADNAGFTSDLETRVTKFPEESPNAGAPQDASQLYSDRHLMLYGLMAWHRLRQSGFTAFPVAHYQGQFPTRRSDELLDVVEVSFADLNVEFFFDSQGRVVSLNCAQFGQVSGCEVYLEDWKPSSDNDASLSILPDSKLPDSKLPDSKLPDSKLPYRISADFHGQTFFEFQSASVVENRSEK